MRVEWCIMRIPYDSQIHPFVAVDREEVRKRGKCFYTIVLQVGSFEFQLTIILECRRGTNRGKKKEGDSTINQPDY